MSRKEEHVRLQERPMVFVDGSSISLEWFVGENDSVIFIVDRDEGFAVIADDELYERLSIDEALDMLEKKVPWVPEPPRVASVRTEGLWGKVSDMVKRTLR